MRHSWGRYDMAGFIGVRSSDVIVAVGGGCEVVFGVNHCQKQSQRHDHGMNDQGRPMRMLAKAEDRPNSGLQLCSLAVLGPQSPLAVPACLRFPDT